MLHRCFPRRCSVLSVSELTSVLQRTFGHYQLYPHQLPAIEAILDGKCCTLAMPANAGKALCYEMACAVEDCAQGEAARMRNITAVLSPYPQTRLSADGEDSHEIRQHSKLPQIQYFQQQDSDAEEVPGISALAQQGSLKRVILDEAQCLSETRWDYCPGYAQKVAALRRLTGHRAQIIAVSSTNEPSTLQAIHYLTRSTPSIVFSVSPPKSNVALKVLRQEWVDGIESLPKLLKLLRSNNPSQRGIWYVADSAEAEVLCGRLRKHGFKATTWPELWSSHQILCAVSGDTSLYRMEVCPRDVRYCLHSRQPFGLDQYQREISVCGLDGEPSVALIQYSPRMSEFHAIANRNVYAASFDQAMARFHEQKRMEAYAENTVVCRRTWLNPAEGEFACSHEAEDGSLNPLCDVCDSREEAKKKWDIDRRDGTQDILAVLEIVNSTRKALDTDQVCEKVGRDLKSAVSAATSLGFLTTHRKKKLTLEGRRLLLGRPRELLDLCVSLPHSIMGEEEETK